MCCFERESTELLEDLESLDEVDTLRLRDLCLFGNDNGRLAGVEGTGGLVVFCLYASLIIFKFRFDVLGLTSAGFEILSTFAVVLGNDAGVVGGSAAKSTKNHLNAEIRTST